MTDAPKVERRAHPRIHISAPIEISGAASGGDDMLGLLEGAGLTILRGATLIDLSRGGARFRVGESVGELGERVQLFLPSLRGGELGLQGKIVRNERLGDQYVVAVQLIHDDAISTGELYEMLDTMLASADAGQRVAPRVAIRMLVRYGPDGDSHAVLEDISTSGLRVLCTEAFFAGDVVSFDLPDSRGEDLLAVTAKVVNQRALPGVEPARFQLGLQFTDLSTERQRCLEALVEALLAR